MTGARSAESSAFISGGAREAGMGLMVNGCIINTRQKNIKAKVKKKDDDFLSHRPVSFPEPEIRGSARRDRHLFSCPLNRFTD
ncbi:MAG: hypothetical protein LUE29_06365 [Lachnospiraceae bacterium]|nr:hypothetical protein [Lachnospiraceae bacterium]